MLSKSGSRYQTTSARRPVFTDKPRGKSFFCQHARRAHFAHSFSLAHTRIGSIARPIIMQIQRHDRHESRSHLLRAANGCRLKSFCALGRFPSKAAAGLEFIRRQDGGGTSR
jgi:hypothetical protein